jgi:phage-related protein (TIGR01555 family)
MGISEIFNDGILSGVFSSLQNNSSGFGTSRDPQSSTEVSYNRRLTEWEVEKLYRNSRIIEKVVTQIPFDATSKPPQLIIGSDLEESLENKTARQIEDQLNQWDFWNLACDAWMAGRLYGDGFIILDINDGQDYNQPLNEKRIKSIDNLVVSDKTQLVPYNVSTRGNFEYYQIVDHEYRNAKDSYLKHLSFIHKSRVLRFPGKKLFGQMLGNTEYGFNDSVIQAMFNDFSQWWSSVSSASSMLASHSMFKYKVKGMRELSQKNNREGLYNRFSTMMMGLSSLKGLILDADGEDAEFVNRNYSGVKDIVETIGSNLSVSAEMPYTMLWGSPQGGAFSESGKSDRYEWARIVAQKQTQTLRPQLNYLTRLIMLANNKRIQESWEWEFPSMLQLTHKEQAELEKIYAESDEIRLQTGVVTIDEVRHSRYGTAHFGYNLQIDQENDNQLENNNTQQEDEVLTDDEDTFKPPESVAKEAKKALDYREKYPKETEDAGTKTGWTRANQLAKRENLSLETVKRMKSFFSRHEKNKKINEKYKDEPWKDNGYLMWLAWGGDSGKTWSEKIVRQQEVDTVNDAKIDGDILSEEEFDAIAEVDDEDIENAIESWKSTASEKWNNLLEAEVQGEEDE